MSIKKPILVFLVVSGVSAFTLLSMQSKLKEYTETQLVLGTYVTIHCFYKKGAEITSITNKCWERIKHIQSSMSANSSTGDIALINKSRPNGVQVNKDVYDLIGDSIEFSELTGGAFDITVLPLVALWKQAGKNKKLPTDIAVGNVKGNVGYKNINLKKNSTVALAKDGMEIDLGAIAKGYAVDEVAKILSKNGIKNFIIDAGGDIYCSGKNEGKRDWKIGIQDPKNKAIILDVLKISNKAVTTSGNYERFYKIGEESFSHIINPITGYPQETVLSATVIAPSAKQADALSTALSVMGGKIGVKLINSLKNIEAVIFEDINGTIKTFRSNGYKKYL